MKDILFTKAFDSVTEQTVTDEELLWLKRLTCIEGRESSSTSLYFYIYPSMSLYGITEEGNGRKERREEGGDE